MKLRITSPDGVIFDGQIEKVNIPTEAGYIGILPGHNPLASVVKPGLVKITLAEQEKSKYLDTRTFVFEEEDLVLSVSKGMLFVDGENIVMVTSDAITSPAQSEEILLQMQQDLTKEVENLKAKGAIEDLEKALINLQKVGADLKLYKRKGIVKK